MELREGIEVHHDGVTFSGSAGKHLLLSLLLRTKFREPYEDITLLNEWIAELAIRLSAQLHTGQLPAFADDGETRSKIAQLIAGKSASLGWWQMSSEEKVACLKLAAAPYPITAESIEEIILDVGDAVERARELVMAADNAT